MEPTMSLNIIYHRHEGARFDLVYYRETHIPLVRKVMRPARVTLIEGVPMDGVSAAFVMIAHFEFASREAMHAALGDPGRADLRADLANFTDIRPVAMLGQS